MQFSFELNADVDLMGDGLYVYYGLDGFHQNIRKYVRSRQDEQLAWHKPSTDTPVQNDIEAANFEKCKENAGLDFFGFVYYPCGLTARYVFDDMFLLEKKNKETGGWQKLDIDTDIRTIGW